MKNVLIGLFMMVACALIVGIILFLQPSVGDGKQMLIVRFSNINGLSLGTRVMFAGKPVGEVVAIEQIKNAREQPTNDLGQVYFYQLILRLDSSVQVYTTDEISVQTLGLLGEKSIAIIPRSPPKGIQASLVTMKTPLYAESIDPLETAFHEFMSLSDKAGETLEKILSWVDQNAQELQSATRGFSHAMDAIATLLSVANQTGLLQDIQVGVQRFSQTMQTAETILKGLDEEGVFRDLGVTMKNTKSASSALAHLLNSIADPKGSFGKLLLGEDTSIRLNTVLSKIDVMMSDINQYGLLFHLNKKWQRSQLKQKSVLGALKTPRDFRVYVHREMDRINASISRLSMLISLAETEEGQKNLRDEDELKKDLIELMQQVYTLYETLKLYNKHLIENKKIIQKIEMSN